MSSLKYRILTIVALVLASAWALFPRTSIERTLHGSTFTYDTVKRVPLKKGLDLQGGMHLTLEVDESKGAVVDKSDAIERALKVVRTRVDQFGVSEPVVQKVGNDRIIVELPGLDDPQRATDVVQKAAFLQFQITDETGALEKVIPRLDGIVKEKRLGGRAGDVRADSAKTPTIKSLFAGSADTSKQKGAEDSTSTTGPFSRLVLPGAALNIQVPGLFYVASGDVPEITSYLENDDIKAALPPGKVLRWGADSVMVGGRVLRPLYVLDAREIITGQYIKDAKPNQDPIEGTIVEFQLDNEGGRRFKSETGKHVKDYMAIVLDDRVMSAPVIQSAIGTRGQITMGPGRDLAEAQDLAVVLRAGALPVPLKVAEVRNIGASLGADSIRKGMNAGVIAIALVILIMLVYYRFSGALAVAGLALYVLYTLAALAGFGAVLTLPGMAGFALSIGIAVDANVLIFERIREEMDHGKSLRTSIDEGFKHAMSAIVDSNVSTALTAIVLYQYGTGPVKGFAVTLLAGIAASMISSIFVVKTFFLVWLHRNRAAETLSI
ncbi:MAG TPA: protein translocase subunit SecD [Gemmatimonadaceae bacterium]|nr:protein translocase subunit SecD [Gemmatimonadaceae bacterium]